jgi:ABC-2 type transport system permease protein
MNRNKLFAIVKREYLAVVKKKSFWLATLFMPLFIVLVSFLSGYSSQQAGEKFEDLEKDIENQQILILDESELLSTEIYKSETFNKAESKEEGIKEIRNENFDAFFYYPEALNEDPETVVEVYHKHKNIIENQQYGSIAQNLIQSSISSEIPPQKLTLLQQGVSTELNAYQDGELKELNFGRFLIPGAAIILYFIFLSFGMNYLLASVSEEKESRMIEILLSTVKTKTLISGKIVGLLGVIFTQMILLGLLGYVAVQFLNTDFASLPIPIDFGSIDIDPLQLTLSLTYIVLGFIVLANIMVGVGSAMPTLKEAQSFSSIFIISAIFPIYLAGLFISEPNGFLAQLFSYLPLTAPLILLFRNALDVLTNWEIVTTILGLLIQVVLSWFIAIKLFEIGALEYKNKLNLKNIWRSLTD